MGKLVDAYFEYAWAIAILHLFLLATLLVIRLREYVRLKGESETFSSPARGEDSQSAFFLPPGDTEAEPAERTVRPTEVRAVTGLVMRMAQKGELLDPGIIRNRLARSYGRYDTIVRTSINGFIVSGLLGTLYNLWKLGPSFWDDIIKGGVSASHPAIGVAFSSSVVGLFLALAVSLIDAWFFLRRRESLIQHVSNKLGDLAIDALPPKDSAAVAQALTKFYNTSHGFLEKLRTNQEEFSIRFLAQISTSTDQLAGTLTSISKEWESLTRNAASSIEKVGQDLTVECNTLTEVTRDSARVLDAANRLSREAESLAAVLLDVRSEAAKHKLDLNSQMERFSEAWVQKLTALTDSHSARLGEAYEKLWMSYSDQEAKSRHEGLAVLDRFALRMEGNTNEWQKERDALAAHVESMVTHWQIHLDKSLDGISSRFESVDVRHDEMFKQWRQQLGTSMTTVQSGLNELLTAIDRLKKVPSELKGVYDIATQQLRSLGQAITAITSRIAEGSPVSETVASLREAVIEFQTLIRQNGRGQSFTPESRETIAGNATPELIELANSISVSNSNLFTDLRAIREILERPPPIPGIDGVKSPRSRERRSMLGRIRRTLRQMFGRGKPDG